MNINNPLEIKRPEGYDKLLAYWSDKGPKPSEAEAWSILQQLLENIRIENNINHPDVVDAMIRQGHSTATKPFKYHFIENNTIIKAVDFDMGRQRYAYFDKDTARYQYTPGVNTQGNRGNSYRNDGVDIQIADNMPYVFNIEDDEWLQYTVNVKASGKYSISFTTTNEKNDASLSLLVNNSTTVKDLIIPVTGGVQNWKTTTEENILLKKGICTIRILAVKGGFNLSAIQFEKQK